jgi:hypothetical protein
MKIHYPKYVRNARQWVVTVVDKSDKLKKGSQDQYWFDTEALAIVEYRRLLVDLTTSKG